MTSITARLEESDTRTQRWIGTVLMFVGTVGIFASVLDTGRSSAFGLPGSWGLLALVVLVALLAVGSILVGVSRKGRTV